MPRHRLSPSPTESPQSRTDPFVRWNAWLDARPIAPLLDKLAKLLVLVVAVLWLWDMPERAKEAAGVREAK